MNRLRHRWYETACTLMLLAYGGLIGGADTAAASERGPDLERGEALYDYWCAPCHAPGPGHPGTESLAVKYGDSLPAALEEREDLTVEVVRLFVREGVLSMPPYRKTEITDEELEDLAGYLAE